MIGRVEKGNHQSSREAMIFNQLTTQIKQTHDLLQQSAGRAINRYLTIRNWLIGYYIVEFEQKGEDRANYGEKLLPNLEESLNTKGFLRGRMHKMQLECQGA